MADFDWHGGKLYEVRFSAEDLRNKEKLWRILCRQFLQRYVSPDDVVVDLGAGFCEFINQISCREKFAVDAVPHTGAHAAPGVTVKADLSEVAAGCATLVFCSNFFEHLPSKEIMLRTLEEIRRVLAPAGRLMILQPNIYYAYREYWDFFDHYLPLSHRTMEEILQATGFEILRLTPRFLPYTTRTRLSIPFLLRLYLALPFLWRFFGKQLFIVARKR